MYWQELEQEEYDPEEFVERLAWRVAGSGEFDAEALNAAIVQAIRDLSVMHTQQAEKSKALEAKTREAENVHRQSIRGLIDRNKASAATYRSLDEKINSVATKVVHLGDQLESVHLPRSRGVEALKLMKHFDEFMDSTDSSSLSPVFTDTSRLHEAADIIKKLHFIAQDLPSDKFKNAKTQIEKKYCEIEKSLIEEFIKSHRSNDIGRMKDLANILYHFKGYSQCVDTFIEQIQLKKFMGKDVFADIVPLCESSWKIITEVFPNYTQVMAKFVLNVYHSKLKEHINNELSDKNKPDQYLNKLHSLYSNTTKLTSDLAKYKLGGSDHLFLSNLTKGLFKNYLENYITLESKNLNEESTRILQNYYESKGHIKKPISGNSQALQELKRDIHGFIAAKINIETSSYGGETFLSEEVAITLLQSAKSAFRRCQVLSQQKDLASNAMEIFNILISYLLHEHVDYALEIALQGISYPESKVAPELYFFDVISQSNAIIHLLEKLFSDSFLPLVVSTNKHSTALIKKKHELEKLEQKLDAGLDRTLSAIVGWVKYILSQEQKKTDFSSSEVTNSSQACHKSKGFIKAQEEKIKGSMDGKNVDIVLEELGVRLHKTIYDHLLTFHYSSEGAMVAICDINEYKDMIESFKVPKVTKLFEVLLAMCNLLILNPSNLSAAIQGPPLASLDRSVLDNWIQLRTDFRSGRLTSYF